MLLCLMVLFKGPPVNVAMAIEVTSIDHISEANMVWIEKNQLLIFYNNLQLMLRLFFFSIFILF